MKLMENFSTKPQVEYVHVPGQKPMRNVSSGQEDKTGQANLDPATGVTWGSDDDGDVMDWPVGERISDLTRDANLYGGDIVVISQYTKHLYWINYKGVDYKDCTISQDTQRTVQKCHYDGGNLWTETPTVLTHYP